MSRIVITVNDPWILCCVPSYVVRGVVVRGGHVVSGF